MESVRERVEAALRGEGFGVLTEIDVAKTMKEKIDADYEPYLILGACNPKFANLALTEERAVGLLLPCNVTLRQVGDQIEVGIVDAAALFSLVDEEKRGALAPLAAEVAGALRRVLEAI